MKVVKHNIFNLMADTHLAKQLTSASIYSFCVQWLVEFEMKEFEMMKCVSQC